MNIIHFTHGKVNPEGGSGISRVVYSLNKYEKLLGHNSVILSVVDGVKKHETYIRDEFVTIEMFPRIGLFYGRNKIFEYIKANLGKIDIVHIHHMWFYDKNPIIHLCNKLNIPIIMTLHGNYANYSFNLKKKIAWFMYEKKYSHLVSAYRALSKEEFSTIRELGVESPCFINYNGVSIELLQQHNSPEIIKENENKIIIINIGRLVEGKNQLEIIKSINLLPEDIKEKVLLLLIGGGNYKYINGAKEYIAKNFLESSIKLLGPIYSDEKLNYLKYSDAFIQTSLSEGMSISIAEAVSLGKPCILTRQNNVSYFYDSEFFIMCEPYADDIARSIMEFCDNKEKHEQMSKNALNFAKNALSHEVITNKMVEIYSKVINNEKF